MRGRFVSPVAEATAHPARRNMNRVLAGRLLGVEDSRMAEFRHRSRIEVSADELFDWHTRPGALERLLPPWTSVKVLEREDGVRAGGRIALRVGRTPFALRWVLEHRDLLDRRQFCDVQIAGPFAKWSHTHRFTPDRDGAVLEDLIDYKLPLGVIGRVLLGRRVLRSLRRAFRFRHARLRNDLRRHARFAEHGPLRVAISGASGLVGRNLAAFLTSGGHRVDRLVRRRPLTEGRDVYWDPSTGEIDAAALEGVDAVVHLAGENVAAGRWNAARKAAIRSSRVDGTSLLCKTLAGLSAKPRVLVAASAVGYYGDRGDEWLDERSAPGTGFLPETCQAWEAAARPASDAGIRVAHLRIGVVFSPSGGALQKMLTPFRLGLGGVLGSGRQFMSWIALDDLVGAIHHALFRKTVHGPVNAVAPSPVTNAEFTKTLGRVLGRPTILPAPTAAVRVVFGEMGRTLLLEGARVRPSALLADGFEFLHPNLDVALRAEIGLPPS